MEPNYYAIIPATVRYDKALPPAAKLLYGEITALSNKEGYCYAGNAYFAELYGVDKDTVSGWLSKLTKAGHIKVDWNAKANERKIFTTAPLRQITDTSTINIVEVSEKNSRGVGEKSDTSTTKDRHNIIVNNTDNNKDVPTEKNKKKSAPKKPYRDNVLLTEKEYSSLQAKFPPQFVEKCLDKLSAQKEAKGTTYKSDYGAINSWVIDAVERLGGFGQEGPAKKEMVY